MQTQPLSTRRSFLDASPPFAFEHSLSFFCSFPPTAGEQSVGPRSLTKAYADGGRAVLTTIEEADRGLAVTTSSETPLDDDAHARIRDRVRFQLSLDDDLALFDARARADRPFAPIARRWRGHHHVKFASPFEITVWAILAARNMRMGRPVKDRIVKALGPSIEMDRVTHRAFPEPHVLADARVVRPLVRTDAEAHAIAAAARTFAEIDVDETLLRTSYDEAEQFLRSLPRIGPWSAAFILFRGLGRMERLAERSGPILAAARRVYGPRPERELRAIAESYGAWMGYWALYLRRS
jgi:DNA-3-methyladenine glycosylase II